jgi:hypothetical protein
MTHNTPNLLRDQALRSAVQHHIRDVIRAAIKTVRRLKPQNNKGSDMRESQLRNVVNVASGASSVEEIAAFILYQMGRSTNSRQWLYGGFGDAVVQDLMSGVVRKTAQSASAEARLVISQAQVGGELNEEQLFDTAYIALARQYLGYLNRLFYFADRTGRWDELGALIEEASGV